MRMAVGLTVPPLVRETNSAGLVASVNAARDLSASRRWAPISSNQDSFPKDTRRTDGWLGSPSGIAGPPSNLQTPL